MFNLILKVAIVIDNILKYIFGTIAMVIIAGLFITPPICLYFTILEKDWLKLAVVGSIYVFALFIMLSAWVDKNKYRVR